MGIKNKETFKYHYNLETENNRCPCGPGSVAEYVKGWGTIDFINNIIKKYNVKSINDCPSGLFENWMYLVDLKNINYKGYDINDLVVERNKNNYPEKEFFEFDLVNGVLPYSDLIVCRDCLFHLSNNFVLKGIQNFIDSGSIYLLATNHNYIDKNKELTQEELEVEAGFRLINLEVFPYNLGKPLEMHNEDVKIYYEAGYYRQMSLWKLN